jgi:hypothetical protein
MNPELYVDVTAVPLAKLIQEVYALSEAQGLGVLHYISGPIPEEEVDRIIKRHEKDERIAASMDYVLGRACKMTVFRKDGKTFINKRWFDHSEASMKELLSRLGL